MIHFLEHTPNILAITATALMSVFTVLYLTLFNWRLTSTSRAFAQFVMSLLSVLLLSVLAIIFGPHYPFRWLARDVVLLWIIYGVGSLLLNLFRKWHHPSPIILEPRARHTRKKP